jgi:glycine/D-amino acid oxidase-like deaminating enzyme
MPAGSVPGSPATDRRKKIAILGGGIAGLNTTLHLSETQALRQQHEITVY